MDQTTGVTEQYITREQKFKIFVFEKFAVFQTGNIYENYLKTFLWDPETNNSAM